MCSTQETTQKHTLNASRLLLSLVAVLQYSKAKITPKGTHWRQVHSVCKDA